MYRYLFIINPKAGSGKTLKIEEKIRSFMEDREKEFDIEYTQKNIKIGDRLENKKLDFNVFVAVGGDGTVREVADLVYKREGAYLGILPLGTGNDYVKSLGFKINLRENLERLVNPTFKKVDLGMVNDNIFLNVASLGYDAEVIVNYNKLTLLKTRFKYFLSVLYTLIKFKSKNISFKAEGFNYEGKITLLAIGKGSYYGGYFKILPESSLDDGKLHVCLVKDINKFLIGLLFPSILFGKHTIFKKYVKILTTSSLSFYSKERINLNLDGEILTLRKQITFKVIPKALNLLG